MNAGENELNSFSQGSSSPKRKETSTEYISVVGEGKNKRKGIATGVSPPKKRRNDLIGM